MSISAVSAYRYAPLVSGTVSYNAQRFEHRPTRYEMVHFGDGDGLSVRMKMAGFLAVLGIGFVFGNGWCASKMAGKDDSRAAGVGVEPSDAYTNPPSYRGVASGSLTQSDPAQQLRNLRHPTDKLPGDFQDGTGRKFYVVAVKDTKAEVADALGLSVEEFDTIYNDYSGQPWAGYAYPVGNGNVGK